MLGVDYSNLFTPEEILQAVKKSGMRAADEHSFLMAMINVAKEPQGWIFDNSESIKKFRKAASTLGF